MKYSAALAILFLPFAAFAAPVPTQITGQLVDVTDNTVVISKGREHLTFARSDITKLPDGLKPGAKVTVEYSMMALSVTEKAEEAAAASGKPAKDKEKTSSKATKMK